MSENIFKRIAHDAAEVVQETKAKMDDYSRTERSKRKERERKWREEHPKAVRALRLSKWPAAAVAVLALVAAFYFDPPKVNLLNKQSPVRSIPVAAGPGSLVAAFYLPHDTRAAIIDRQFLQDPGLETGVEWVRIRVVSGEHYDAEGWVTEHLVRDLPPPG